MEDENPYLYVTVRNLYGFITLTKKTCQEQHICIFTLLSDSDSEVVLAEDFREERYFFFLLFFPCFLSYPQIL